MTQPIAALRDAYAGQTCYVVGKGPSLLHLTAEHFGQPGPIITLNQAIRKVQALGLSNPIMSMQKDGAYPFVCGAPCPNCPDVGINMVRPADGALLLVSKANSEHCFADYRPRYTFDTEVDFGLRSTMPSGAVAVCLAELLGCTALVFVAMDACTTGDCHTVMDGLSVLGEYWDGPSSYQDTAERIRTLLAVSSIRDVRWITPQEVGDAKVAC